MRKTTYQCDYCKKEIDEGLAIQDEEEYNDKDFCSYKCLYGYYGKETKQLIKKCLDPNEEEWDINDIKERFGVKNDE